MMGGYEGGNGRKLKNLRHLYTHKVIYIASSGLFYFVTLAFVFPIIILYFNSVSLSNVVLV